MFGCAQMLPTKRRIVLPLPWMIGGTDVLFTGRALTMNATSQAHRRSRLRTALALAGVVIFAGCASTPPAPTASVEAAKQAISNAERADAGRYAAGELSAARIRLASAETAVTERKMIVAEQFAAESRAEAELASAKTAASKAKAVNDEMKLSTATLVEEMKRSSGDKR